MSLPAPAAPARYHAGMAYQGGAKTVGSATGVAICVVPVGGEALVQNNGTTPVTLGGAAGITAGVGIVLPANMATPVLLPSGVVRGTTDADDQLYGRTAAGSASVGFLVAG